jgi:hypothetical protein
MLRGSGAEPVVASLLCIAAALRAQTKADQLADVVMQIYADPTKAVSFTRHYEMVREKLAEADSKLEDKDRTFEDGLAAIRKEMTKER